MARRCFLSGIMICDLKESNGAHGRTIHWCRKSCSASDEFVGSKDAGAGHSMPVSSLSVADIDGLRCTRVSAAKSASGFAVALKTGVASLASFALNLLGRDNVVRRAAAQRGEVSGSSQNPQDWLGLFRHYLAAQPARALATARPTAAWTALRFSSSPRSFRQIRRDNDRRTPIWPDHGYVIA